MLSRIALAAIRNWRTAAANRIQAVDGDTVAEVCAGLRRELQNQLDWIIKESEKNIS